MGWIKIRTLALISAGVASLSILSAGISGIPFLPLLFRALVSALAAAVMTLGVSWLIQRFLPELLQESGGSEHNQRGGNIDITVQQDDESDEPQEIGPQVPYQETPDEPETEENEDLEDVPEDRPARPVESEPPRSFNESGKLPDIGSFSSDFNSGAETEATPPSEDGNDSESEDGIGNVEHRKSSRSDFSSTDDEAKDFFKANSSPEEMAKAIRTIVKRDED